MKSLFVIATLAVCTVTARPENSENPQGKTSKCGYDACNPIKKDVINVHMVPHTHDDVGWLKTVDQYYYGSRTGIQRAGVQYILDSVIDELLKDSTRKFVYVEAAFFKRWWVEQNEERQNEVHQLVAEGRLEFAGGAWSMNDEAAAHYHSVVDQLTWGLRMFNDTFGACGVPKVGWQIDPFGHSRELTNVWAMAGYDGVFAGRIDYQDKARRIKDKEMEVVMRASDDTGKASDILFGVLYNHYSPPPGFCFDILCNDDPIIDDPESADYNLDAMVEKFVAFVKNQASAFKTNNVILTMGEDFHYQDALMWFKNMDKLIKYINEREKSLNLFYSTPGCYLKSLHDSNIQWPSMDTDFFPYASDDHSFWTGYFTSRPTSKYFERKGNNLLQACKQLYTLSNLAPGNETLLNKLRESMGIFQHHDAITGTEKQHVADDYARTLHIAMQKCLNVSTYAFHEMMTVVQSRSVEPRPAPTYFMPMDMCQLNNTECKITEYMDNFVITLYNPLSHPVEHSVRLPVKGLTYEVRDANGKMVDSEVLPVDTETLKRQSGQLSATGELVFIAPNIPALGYSGFYIRKLKEKNIAKKFADDEYSISNEHISVKVNPTTGYVENIVLKKTGGKEETIQFHQELVYYKGVYGNNTNSERRASGAYIFRPNGSEPISITQKPENKVLKGEKVQELHQKFSNWASQVIRLYQGEKRIEFEWMVGPIPIEDDIGKEVISRFTTNFKSNSEFYTDSNGRQMLKRVRNKRPTWDIDLKEEVAGNYYPVTSMIGLKDSGSKNEMYVLNDRAQGGSSLKDGQLELMVHRRLLRDDAFGVGEALNETVNGVGLFARGMHYLIIGDEEFLDHPPLPQARILALEKLLMPVAYITSAENLTYDRWMTRRNELGAINELPPNVHILTLEPWKDGSVLLRLENFLQKGDFPTSSNEVTVDLNKIFKWMKITSVRETLLAANQWKDEAKRLEWQVTPNKKNTETDDSSYIWRWISNKLNNKDDKTKDDKVEVTLGPMEIKTFVITVEYNY